ncbi:MAG: NAD(P)H-dependent oxidoreductase subunit E [Acidimicrobiaceae bacterium]|nr:NAD(P)H-dependent oxidoreductase subunit E [Acidimicrobiaceae bacterium]
MTLSPANEALAAEIISWFPRPRSALIPLLHLAQEQDGYLTDDAMRRVGELVGATPAEVKGTAGFYEMFRFEPVGTYLVNVCTNISCLLWGGEELLEHACESLEVEVGGTTDDGMFTVEEAECIAACTEAPCLQVNYRYRGRVTPADFDGLVEDLRAGRTGIAGHGVLAQVRQSVPAERLAGVFPPEQAREAPVWLARNEAEAVG